MQTFPQYHMFRTLDMHNIQLLNHFLRQFAPISMNVNNNNNNAFAEQEASSSSLLSDAETPEQFQRKKKSNQDSNHQKGASAGAKRGRKAKSTTTSTTTPTTTTSSTIPSPTERSLMTPEMLVSECSTSLSFLSSLTPKSEIVLLHKNDVVASEKSRYDGFIKKGARYAVGDFVFLQSENALPYVGRIAGFCWPKRYAIKIQWIYRPEDIQHDNNMDPNDMALSDHYDIVSMESVLCKAQMLLELDNGRRICPSPSAKNSSILCRWFFNAGDGKLSRLRSDQLDVKRKPYSK